MNTGVPPKEIRAPRGTTLTCKTWAAEAAYRMLQNSLDPEVAESPNELIVYGGSGKAARNWACVDSILQSLVDLGPDETLLIQSGKPVGIVRSHADAPRVLIANSNLVPRWATAEIFNELEQKGLIMYGQMTAGSWIYIGTQGILQGTYETFSSCGRKHFSDSAQPLRGQVVVSAGLGGMGGAQPLAATLSGAAFLGIEVDRARIDRRLSMKYVDEFSESLEDAWERVSYYATAGKARSIALHGNAAEVLPEMVRQGLIPNVLTDQTSAHDPLNGYIPIGLSVDTAESLRHSNPESYITQSLFSIGQHVEAMLQMKALGSVVFDYGNNIRGMAEKAGISNVWSIPGFVPEYIRPLFCSGSGPFRWVALSGDPEDILATDLALLELFPENERLQNWLKNGAPRLPFQGLPARICWLGYGEREKAGLLFNELVRSKKVSAPIVIGRDHLDCGSVASPYRETERMLDGSDAISDWVFLNALSNAVNGASWVSIHHGGGVGIGYSQHAGMVIVADGTDEAEHRIKRVLTSDPLLGILRHADAGYSDAIGEAQGHAIPIPMNPEYVHR